MIVTQTVNEVHVPKEQPTLRNQRNDFFLWILSFFIVGTVLSGLGISLAITILLIFIVSATMLFYRVPLLLIGIFALFCVTGSAYYTIDDYRYYITKNSLQNKTQFEGRVTSLPVEQTSSQIATVALSTPIKARVFVHLNPYPKIEYGDVLRLEGSIVPPPSDSYGNYLAKEHIHGTLFYPTITISEKKPNAVFTSLYAVRTYTKNTLRELFQEREAAFLIGNMLGDKEGFSKDFLQKLSISGTLHLIALSGFHMTIIVFITLTILNVLFPRNKRLVFTLTFLFMGAFVAMTGFAVSAVRAALMAFVVGLAHQTGRLYDQRNALLFAAFVIAVWNPKAPVFDLGFQLSFAATIAIIYLTPLFKQIPFFRTEGFLGWREVLAITITAQLGVLPITIINFQNFSLTSLPANALILPAIPLLMVLGFLTIGASLFSSTLAVFFSKPTAFLLDYSVFIVDFFSSIPILFNPHIGTLSALIYYLVLLLIYKRFSPAIN